MPQAQSTTLPIFALVLTLLASCSSQPAQVPPAHHSAQLASQQQQDKPPLITLERDGDPYAALAAAVVHGGDARGSAAVARAAVARLTRTGYLADARIFAAGFVLRVRLPAPKRGNPVDDLRRSLAGPIKPDAVDARRAASDACGVIGEPKSPQELQRRIGSESVALAFTGSAAQKQELEAFYRSAAAWPRGSRWRSTWPDGDQVLSSTARDGEWIDVSLLTQHTDKLWSAASTLENDDNTLRMVADSAGWTVDATHAGLLESGGCLSIRLRSQGAAGAAAIARLASDELKRVLARSPAMPQNAFALSASDPEDASARAAWSALNRKTSQPERLWIRHASPSNPSAAALAFKQRFSEPPPSIPTRTALEKGQGQLWALLTHRCPTQHESRARAGHTAAALLAAANADPQIEAWISPRGLGLFVRESAFEQDAADRLVERLARALALAERDPASVAVARQQLLKELPHAEAWNLGIELASGDHPSRLYPPGLAHSVARLSADQAQRALRDFLRGPLDLVVLSPTDEGLGQRIQRRLEQLLAPFIPAPLARCSAAPKDLELKAIAGQYLVQSSDPTAYLLWPIATAQLPTARTLADMLRGGLLQRALRTPNLVREADAFVLGQDSGHAALVVSVTAPDQAGDGARPDKADALEEAVLQARALMLRLQQGAGLDSHYQAHVRALAEMPAAADPRQRLLNLWFAPTTPPKLATLRQFASDVLAEDRLILVRPKDAEITPSTEPR